MVECMQLCQKYENSRSPYISSVQEFEVFNAKVNEWRGDIRSGGLWMSMTDVDKEGIWRDWYNGDIINLTDYMTGGLASEYYFFN